MTNRWNQYKRGKADIKQQIRHLLVKKLPMFACRYISMLCWWRAGQRLNGRGALHGFGQRDHRGAEELRRRPEANGAAEWQRRQDVRKWGSSRGFLPACQPNDGNVSICSVEICKDQLKGVHMAMVGTVQRRRSMRGSSSGWEESGRSFNDAMAWIAQQKVCKHTQAQT